MRTYRRVGALGNEIVAQLLVLVGKTIVQASVALVVLVVDVAGAPQQLLCQHEDTVVAGPGRISSSSSSSSSGSGAWRRKRHAHTHTHTTAAAP